MHLQATNKLARTHDVSGFCFEPAGGLSSITNTQGSPCGIGSYICFAELKQACPFTESSTLGNEHHERFCQR